MPFAQVWANSARAPSPTVWPTVLHKQQRRFQNFPVGGDDEILANWQIEMLRSDVCSVVRKILGWDFGWFALNLVLFSYGLDF